MKVIMVLMKKIMSDTAKERNITYTEFLLYCARDSYTPLFLRDICATFSPTIMKNEMVIITIVNTIVADLAISLVLNE